jgi:plasmid maintenance system antidote protein VapI
MNVTDSLKALIALKKVNKRDLSEALGIPWNTLNRYLAGQNDISSDKFIKILRFLGIDIPGTLNQSIKDILNEEKTNNKNLQSLSYILRSLDDIDRKVHLEDLIVSATKKYKLRPEPKLQNAIKDLKEYTK